MRPTRESADEIPVNCLKTRNFDNTPTFGLSIGLGRSGTSQASLHGLRTGIPARPLLPSIRFTTRPWSLTSTPCHCERWASVFQLWLSFHLAPPVALYRATSAIRSVCAIVVGGGYWEGGESRKFAAKTEKKGPTWSKKKQSLVLERGVEALLTALSH